MNRNPLKVTVYLNDSLLPDGKSYVIRKEKDIVIANTLLKQFNGHEWRKIELEWLPEEEVKE